MLTKKEWETFFGLVDKIANGEGSYESKAETVLAKSKEFNSEDEFSEFVSWFDTDMENVDPDDDDDDGDDDDPDEDAVDIGGKNAA